MPIVPDPSAASWSRRDAVMGIDAAGDHAAAVKEHEAGRRLGCVIGR